MPTTRTVNMHVAKSTLSKLVRQALEGDEIIIARAGKPVAKIVPYEVPARPSILGALKDVIPEISDEAWEASDREIAKLWEHLATKPVI